MSIDTVPQYQIPCQGTTPGHVSFSSPCAGGFQAFVQQFPELCEQSNGATSSTPIHVSVSASLPISLQSGKRKLQLLSAPLNDSDRFGPPVELLPYLILGCAHDSADLAMLERLGVTAVLNVSHNCPSLFTSQFEYMEIRVPDTYQADLLSKLDDAFSFIGKCGIASHLVYHTPLVELEVPQAIYFMVLSTTIDALHHVTPSFLSSSPDDVKARGGRVLVHCHAGVSRSATVCMAYIMKTLGYNLRSAYDYVKSRRSCVSPNLHFMGQLLEFEKQLGRYSACSTPQELDPFQATLCCVEETEIPTPAAADMPTIWGGGEKRRAISTPSSLNLSDTTCSSVQRPQPLQLTSLPLKQNSTSLPSTPISLFRHTHPPTRLHSRSLQSLTLFSPCRVAAKDIPLPRHHRHVTESL